MRYSAGESGHGDRVPADGDRGAECARRDELPDHRRECSSPYAESTKQSVEAVFNRFLRDTNISVILITQEASDKFLRELISQREEIYPVILEIPSKEKPYDPVKDVVMQRAHRLLYGSELSENS